MSYADAVEPTAREAISVSTKPRVDMSLAAGLITGQAAGLIMAVVMMFVFTVFLGKEPFFPVQVIGSFIFGDKALDGFHQPALVAGLVLHQLGPSFFWGVAFGLVTYALDIRRGSRLLGLAVGAGILSQIIDVNLIIPFAFRALHGHDIWAEQVPAFWSWAAHLAFGAGLALFPFYYDRLEVVTQESSFRWDGNRAIFHTGS